MNYWLFNAEKQPQLSRNAEDIWFEENMGYSANEREKYGVPLGKMVPGDRVLMYVNNKGYVGIGTVTASWNGKGYKQKHVYKGCDYPEYRISINWQYDLRRTPFEIGWVSPQFLCSVTKPELLERIKTVLDCASKGYLPRPLAEEASEYLPTDEDERQEAHRQVKERRGQRVFRDKLLKRYGKRCQVTGSELLDVIEAAHIRPHRGTKDHHVGNGMLLRADVHTLFDLDLIGIEPGTLKIICSKNIKHEYANVVRNRLLVTEGNRPSEKALQYRYKRFCYRQ
ncbi:MAG: HNH endonuclease [Lacipirellulaceae bacterium]